MDIKKSILVLSIWFAIYPVYGEHEENRYVPDKIKNRAFYTAPPTVPHEVRSISNSECVTCHKINREFSDGRKSVISPHIEWFNCQQCHVSQYNIAGEIEQEIPLNNFEGLEKPDAKHQAHEWAPPMIPHRTFLRENCNSCHSSETPKTEIKGPHHQRTNCLQCHVMNEDLDF